MLKNLPKIKILFLTFLFSLILLFNFSPFSVHKAFAADPVSTVPDNTWIRDPDVTFAGKSAVRSEDFLDWTLTNYNWSSVAGVNGNPLAQFWQTIETIVLAFAILFVLVTAFIIIITRGKNITIMRFIPRFIMIVLLIVLSFSIVQFIYQITDAIQGFFLTNSAHQIIGKKDLLYIAFPYDFQGYRLSGTGFDETVFSSLLLVKLTALTYYVMSGILLLRKIILWFFIVISPIFPLLLFYSPIRNTAKIWLGEFFRWLLYAPLFAIFLSGLVHMWSSSTGTVPGIPLNFNINSSIEYPTAISILLGGPGQTVSLSNSVNNPNTFALYVVALLMLWVVIILPFLLLQIFLDFFHEFSFSESNIIKQLMAGGSSVIGRGSNGKPPPPPAGAPQGLAKPLPFIPAKIAIPQIRTNEATVNAQAVNMRGAQTTNIQGSRVHSEMLNLTNLSIPTMRDIAKYETSLLSSNIGSHQEVARVHETLEGIANPRRVSVSTQREKFTVINDKLKQEAQRGDPLATSILSAANSVVSKTSVVDTARLTKVFRDINNLNNVSSFEERQKLTQVKKTLSEAAGQGDPLATSILSAMQKETTEKGKIDVDENLKAQLLQAKEKGSQLALSILEAAGLRDVGLPKQEAFPSANRVQSVSFEDYESVKKIWQENYRKLESPKSVDGQQRTRKEWATNDIDKINRTINLLVSSDPQTVSKGMEEVGTILPFLLIGGFSQTEVVAYLKAKLEAARSVILELDKQQNEEETMLGRETKKQETLKEMSAETEQDLNEAPIKNDDPKPEDKIN